MRLLSVTALIALVLTLFGCAGGAVDIDRTQPGKLRKSALDGEWYFRQTIIDVPYTTGVTFIGEQSYLDRVRWEISEKMLTAYRTYERVEGSEIPSTLPGQDYQGAPVAAFRIDNHFDVIREYNATTGEQTNVLIEDETDRPWYERDYMRIDWSQNLLANFDFLAGGAQGLGVTSQAASYVVTDPDDPDAPVFGVREGSGWTDHRDPVVWGTLETFDYFDVTLKLQVTPDTFEIYWDDGTVDNWPACWFYDIGPWDCASQTVKLRASFLRAAPSDYEPLHYPDNYVARDADSNPYMERDICNCDATWSCDPDGPADCRCDGDCPTVDRACSPSEANALAECSKVHIPMFDRFGYFRIERETYDRDYELTEQGRRYWIARHNIWERSQNPDGSPIAYADRPVKKITYYLSPSFPIELTADALEIGDWWNAAFVETVNSLKGNTDTTTVFEVLPNSYAVDGNGDILDFGQRNGDLRYSHLYWVDDPQFEALLGYGPSGADPLTGEVIVADAYVYGAAIDSYAAYGADIIDVMRGDILETEFIDGENIAHAIAQIRQSQSQNRSRQQMRDQIGSSMQRGLSARLQRVRDAGPNAFKRNYDWVGSRLRIADESPLFDGLWNNEMSQAFESRFGRRLKPSEFGGRRILRAIQRHRRKLGARGVDLRAFDDQALLGLVDELQGASRAQVVAAIRSYLFKSTGAHEIGHTLGLRHNFAGSADPLNYFDAYWDVRSPTAQALDLPTQTEMQNGLRELAYSSLMDYSAKFMSDIRGLGKYDVAAIKFGYGQLVEVFANPPKHALLNPNIYNIEQIQDWIHYTDLPTIFTSAAGNDGIANMRARSNVPYAAVTDWLAHKPGATDFTDRVVPYKFCSDEYDGAAWDCATFDEGADPYEIVSNAAEDHRDYYIFRAFKRNRRFIDPFDYYLGTYYRTMLPMATQYQMWIWDQWWKSGEWDWLDGLSTDPDFSAAYPAVASALQGYLENADWNLDRHGGLTGTAAAISAFNYLAEVIATPEPGSYFLNPADEENPWPSATQPSTLTWWTPDEDPAMCNRAFGENSWDFWCSDLYLPVSSSSRYAISEFDGDSGYYWYERIRVIGSFWDKLAAIETLADPSTYFLGVDDVANYTQFILGFNIAFPHAVSTMFGAIINDDYRKFAAEAQLDATGEGLTIVTPPYLSGISEGYNDQPPTDRPTGANPYVIDPATNFTISIYAMWYGMALLNANFDQTFNDNAKIWLEGSGESFTPDPTRLADVATFSNPFNGRIYHALNSTDASTYSLGHELLTRAETLGSFLSTNTCAYPRAGEDPLCADRRWQLQVVVENIELVRGYYDYYGYSFW